MEYQSEKSKLLDPAKSILANTATEEEISNPVQNFGKKKPRKRRKLILLNDDDDEALFRSVVMIPTEIRFVNRR